MGGRTVQPDARIEVVLDHAVRKVTDGGKKAIHGFEITHVEWAKVAPLAKH